MFCHQVAFQKHKHYPFMFIFRNLFDFTDFIHKNKGDWVKKFIHNIKSIIAKNSKQFIEQIFGFFFFNYKLWANNSNNVYLFQRRLNK